LTDEFCRPILQKVKHAGAPRPSATADGSRGDEPRGQARHSVGDDLGARFPAVGQVVSARRL